jgi:integrase
MAQKVANCVNLAEQDPRVATTRREQKVPTMEQIKHVFNAMPADIDIERRNQALVAFTLLTGARDSAIASMKLKHVDLITNRVYQDARDVKTKFSKTFNTFFFPVGEEVREIVAAWVSYHPG